MIESEQADFLEELFRELYKHRESVYGVNYWVTYDSSTAVLRMDYSEKPAVAVIRKYLRPETVKGIVTNTLGDPLEGVTVQTGDGVSSATTSSTGEYSLLLPVEEVQLVIEFKDHAGARVLVTPDSDKDAVRTVRLEPQNKSFFYTLREWISFM